MGEWRVIILRPARRYLEKLPKDELKRVFKALEELEQDPFQVSIKPLQGRPEWSLRVGDKRILMRVDQQNKVIVVLLIRPRGDVYKH